MSPVIVTGLIATPDPQVWAHLLRGGLEEMLDVNSALQREEPRANADPIRPSEIDVVLL